MLIGIDTHGKKPAPSPEPRGDSEPTVGAVAASVGAPLVPLLQFGIGGVLDVLVTIVVVLFMTVSLAAVVLYVYSGMNMEYEVQVTDAGVDLDARGPMRSYHEFVPFEDVRRVEYTDSVGAFRYARDEDKFNPSDDAKADGFITNPRLFNVTPERLQAGDVAGCVRIEYDGGRPAYVGSDRYQELAATIADNAPRVDRSEELHLGGGADT